jgi:hypothetical protein
MQLLEELPLLLGGTIASTKGCNGDEFHTLFEMDLLDKGSSRGLNSPTMALQEVKTL